jgi:hypothetical protein
MPATGSCSYSTARCGPAPPSSANARLVHIASAELKPPVLRHRVVDVDEQRCGSPWRAIWFGAFLEQSGVRSQT